MRRTLAGTAPVGVDEFEVGKHVAVTPGKVVFRNELIELIQYEPTTKQVYAEPLLVVPAWIMKYYILDLSPRNSLVKYLVDQGHTVFMISWKNPDEKDRDIGMDDYVAKGFRAALDAVAAIVPKHKVHAVGYCIGGTLLSIGAAALARDKDERLASVTMFAAQTDFSEPGELAFFINPSQLAMLEATMHRKGVLESRQMGGAFALLRAQDLLWQPMIKNYLKGKRDPMIDLMAWNADGTRMPWRMHSEYLYRLYLDNELATNRFPVDGKLIRLSDLSVPMFVVGTETDHVAPWKSVYKVDNLVRSDDVTFLLTSGGHNAGIVSGPVHPKRHYRVRTRRLADPHLAPEDWLEAAPKHDGSWWPAWQHWLVEHSSSKTKPPAIGAPRKGYRVVENAPGRYVRQR
jgi:polyhydroxyalkanoate synthase